MTESEASALAPPIPQDILDIFKLASEQEVKITLESEKSANALRFKFHRTRKQMRKNHHYLLGYAEQVLFSVEANILIARPADLDYRDALYAVLAPHKTRLEKERRSIEKKIQDDEEAWMAEEQERLNKKHIEQREAIPAFDLLKKGKRKL